jgi:hypothetical protein
VLTLEVANKYFSLWRIGRGLTPPALIKETKKYMMKYSKK